MPKTYYAICRKLTGGTMRFVLLLLLLALSFGTTANAALIVDTGNAENIALAVITDLALNPLFMHVQGTDTLFQTPSGDLALLTDAGAAPPNTILFGTNGIDQAVQLALNLATFTGTSIDAVGTAATALTNAALLELVGDVRLQLSLVSAVDSPTFLVFFYNVTAIGPADSDPIPEPSTAALLIVPAAAIAFRQWRRRAA